MAPARGPKLKLLHHDRGRDPFDITAYRKPDDERPTLLGEIKKSSKEVRGLRDDLLALSDGAPPHTRRKNSLKKWNALLAMQPDLVWLVGPDDEHYVYRPAYPSTGATLNEVDVAALDFASV